MGEAKRRHARPIELGDLVPSRNVTTGETMMARNGGDFQEFRKGRSPVPCKGCTACCFFKTVAVQPEKERPEDIERLQIEYSDEKQAWLLKKREDGGCVHLGENGCTVYEHRPAVCRHYDCRIPSIYDLRTNIGEGHDLPRWSFVTKSQEDARTLTAMALAGRRATEERLAEGKPRDELATINRANALLPEILAKMP
jgi:Fe-S-cluster containining protein